MSYDAGTPMRKLVFDAGAFGAEGSRGGDGLGATPKMGPVVEPSSEGCNQDISPDFSHQVKRCS